MEQLTLRENQQAVMDYMLASPTRSALIAGAVGFGKTLLSVEYAKAVNAQTVLVIAPKNTFMFDFKGWRPTFKRQGFTLPQLTILSTNTNWEKLRKGEAGIYYINREFFGISGTEAMPKMNKVTGTLSKGRPMRYDWSQISPDLVIFDEIHAAQNRKSNIADVLKRLKPTYKVGLSATPAGDKFKGIWSVTRWLFPDHVDRSFWRWAMQWAVVESDPYAGKVVKEELKAGEFVKTLPCYVFIESDMPPENRIEVKVNLSRAQSDQYQQALHEEIVWLEDNPLVIDYPIVRRTRLKQMALGTVIGEEVDEEGNIIVRFDHNTVSSKLDWVQQYIADNPDENLLIVTSSNTYSEAVAQRLGSQARAWNGNTKDKDRAKILESFGKDVKYIVAQHRAIAEGIDGLQYHAHTLIALDENLYNTLNIQVVGRLNRYPQSKPVDYYVLLAEDTIDTTDMENLLKKAAAIRESTHV